MGELIPENVALDADGNPLDPCAALKDLFAFGHKGYALSFMFEIMRTLVMHLMVRLLLELPTLKSSPPKETLSLL